MTSLRHTSWLLALVPLAPLAACGIVLESGSDTPSADAGMSSGQTASSSGSSSGTVSSSSSGAPTSSSSSGEPSSSSSSGAVSSGGSSSGCVPQTCAGTGRVCGSIDDGCGGTVECGTCGPDLGCSGAGQCSCLPVLPSECNGTCARITNACGNFHDCTCATDETCDTNKMCQPPCVPEAQAVTCARMLLGKKVCGSVKNNCDTIVDCTRACPNTFTCVDCDGNIDVNAAEAMCCR